MGTAQILLLASALLVAAVTPLIIFMRGKKTMKRFKIAVAANVVIFFGAMIFLLIYILAGGPG